MALVQGVAPSIGAAVLFIAPWQAIYAALAAIGAVLLAAGTGIFEELQARAMQQSLSVVTILASYRRALTNPLCAGFSLDIAGVGSAILLSGQICSARPAARSGLGSTATDRRSRSAKS